MPDPTILFDWLEFALRWLHVITAIAWIGSSFYFIALDLGLRKADDLPEGAHGEEWQVHGGGFYHIRKYLVAPAQMPEHLTWFKWESYSTWLSGAALLMVVYWAGAELYLIDPGKAGLSAWQGIAISAASLAAGWLVYDGLCRSGLGARPGLLMVLLFALLMAMGWGYAQIFTGRAVMLHLGAFTATVMTANVFFVIIPNQRVVVADLRAGRVPEAGYGRIAKLRSTHNNYLTLPVVLLMLSPHYPLAFATPHSWMIAALVFPMGVTIRHWFNSRHAGIGRPYWTWAVTVLLFAAIVWLSSLPGGPEGAEEAAPDRRAAAFAGAEGFDEVAQIVLGRCSMCHARSPGWPGMREAPRNVRLDTPARIARHARPIYLQAGASRAMPPANVIWMEEDERRTIVAWYRAGRQLLAAKGE